GLRDSSSTLLADNCDEFIFYEDLIQAPAPKRRRGAAHDEAEASGKQTESQVKAEAFYLVVDAVKAFKREGYDSIWASMVKQTIKRKHPSFNEQRHGYDTFSDLIEEMAAHHIIDVKRDEKSGNYQILGLGRNAKAETTRVSR